MTTLNRQSHVRMADLVTCRKTGKIGIVNLSETAIRKLIKAGEFPPPRKYPYINATFFVYGEVLDWLEKQNTTASNASKAEAEVIQ